MVYWLLVTLARIAVSNAVSNAVSIVVSTVVSIVAIIAVSIAVSIVVRISASMAASIANMFVLHVDPAAPGRLSLMMHFRRELLLRITW